MNKLLFLTLIATSLVAGVFSVICRDGSSCPGNGSCCQNFLPNGGYTVACCPFPNAVCPIPGQESYCCPNGYRLIGRGGCAPGRPGLPPFRPSAGNGFFSGYRPF